MHASLYVCVCVCVCVQDLLVTDPAGRLFYGNSPVSGGSPLMG